MFTVHKNSLNRTKLQIIRLEKKWRTGMNNNNLFTSNSEINYANYTWRLPEQGKVYELPTSPILERQARGESEVRSYPRRIPISIKKAFGPYVSDENDQVFLDCLACAGALPLGHNHPEVVEAIINAMHDLIPMQTLDIMTPAKDTLMTELTSALPLDFRKSSKIQFCGPTGADAVEAAIKLAKTVTGRSSIISFQGGYHGMTHGALSLTGNLSAKNPIQGLMADVHFMPYPYSFRSQFDDASSDNSDQCLRYLRSQLFDPEGGIKKPAAIILEVVQGEGGVIPAPTSWLKGVRKLCTELDILLIIDEVQTGFGRCGSMFAFEKADITPDIIVMSKALGGGLPLSAIAFQSHLDAWSPGGHSGTFRGNQLAMVSGATTLNIIRRDNLAQHAENIGQKLRADLERLKHKHQQIGEVRGKGLMIGIELVAPDNQKDQLDNPASDSKYASRVQRAALERGLICELGGRNGSVVRLLPPLILNNIQAAFIVRVLDESLTIALQQKQEISVNA